MVYIPSHSVIEDKDGRFLIGLRPESKSYEGGLWALPGGHIDTNDSNPSHTALRETKEETGYDVSVGKLILYQHLDETQRYVYESVVIGGELKCHEFDELNWFYPEDIKELPEGLTDMTKTALSVYLNMNNRAKLFI